MPAALQGSAAATALPRQGEDVLFAQLLRKDVLEECGGALAQQAALADDGAAEVCKGDDVAEWALVHPPHLAQRALLFDFLPPCLLHDGQRARVRVDGDAHRAARRGFCRQKIQRGGDAREQQRGDEGG